MLYCPAGEKQPYAILVLCTENEFEFLWISNFLYLYTCDIPTNNLNRVVKMRIDMRDITYSRVPITRTNGRESKSVSSSGGL